jgi:hypothetical protein
MKWRRMRGEYWLDASDSATMVIENVTPATVIIEPAMLVKRPREPSAPTPNRRGQRPSSHSRPSHASTSIRATASATAPMTSSVGSSHRLDRRFSSRWRNLCIGKAVAATRVPTSAARPERSWPPARRGVRGAANECCSAVGGAKWRRTYKADARTRARRALPIRTKVRTTRAARG